MPIQTSQPREAIINSTTHRRSRAAAIAVPALAAALTLSGCGGGGATTTTAAGTTPAAAPTPSRSGGQFGNSEQFARIRACLAAAGIQLPTPTGRPFGTRTGPPPTGMRGTPPSGAPRTGPPPTGRPGGGQFGRIFSDPQVVAALKACGIAVPTRPPGGFNRASPTA